MKEREFRIRINIHCCSQLSARVHLFLIPSLVLFFLGLNAFHNVYRKRSRKCTCKARQGVKMRFYFVRVVWCLIWIIIAYGSWQIDKTPFNACTKAEFDNLHIHTSMLAFGFELSTRCAIRIRSVLECTHALFHPYICGWMGCQIECV